MTRELRAVVLVHNGNMNNVVLVLNPHAGSLRGSDLARTADEMRDAFAKAGVALAAVRFERGEELKTLCRELAAERPGAVIIGGGDGSISTAAGGLIESGIPLGVLPLGTLNHFAADLGLPTTWREAVPVLTAARIGAADVGEVNGRVFLNNCSLGAYPEAVRRRDALRRDRGTRKLTAMIFASVSVFRRLRLLRFRAQSAGAPRLIRAPFLLVANNRYSGHVLDGSLRQRLDEHRLWVYTTRVQRRGALLRLVWQSLVRRIDLADDLESWPSDALTIDIERHRARVPVGIDGEVTDLAPPLRFRIRPAALKVLVGASNSQR